MVYPFYPRIIHKRIGSSPPEREPLASRFQKWPLANVMEKKVAALRSSDTSHNIARSKRRCSYEVAVARNRMLSVRAASTRSIGKLRGLVLLLVVKHSWRTIVYGGFLLCLTNSLSWIRGPIIRYFQTRCWLNSFGQFYGSSDEFSAPRHFIFSSLSNYFCASCISKL
jgi:hypothetical protein